MGKKRVITVESTQEELTTEKEKINKAIAKGEKADVSKRLKEGRIYIYSSYNNTIISLTDINGNVLAQTSPGALGFKGTKKSTPYAASKTAEVLVEKAQKIGMDKVRVLISGIGAGRASALRTLGNYNFEITSIEDVTPIPHNGCRPRRARRV